VTCPVCGATHLYASLIARRNISLPARGHHHLRRRPIF
jgi:hypothetical protein